MLRAFFQTFGLGRSMGVFHLYTRVPKFMEFHMYLILMYGCILACVLVHPWEPPRWWP